MIQEKIHCFKTVPELQQLLESNINTLKQKSDNLSKLIGEKLRATEAHDAAEFQELKEKLEGVTNDPKKKSKKKDTKSNWHKIDSVSVYNGIGLKGELELYFKAMEQSKVELERLTKIKQTIDDLVTKGVKKDLSGIFFLNHDLPAEIAFSKSPQQRGKFAFKAIFSVTQEESHEIKIL